MCDFYFIEWNCFNANVIAGFVVGLVQLLFGLLLLSFLIFFLLLSMAFIIYSIRSFVWPLVCDFKEWIMIEWKKCLVTDQCFCQIHATGYNIATNNNTIVIENSSDDASEICHCFAQVSWKTGSMQTYTGLRATQRQHLIWKEKKTLWLKPCLNLLPILSLLFFVRVRVCSAHLHFVKRNKSSKE